MCGRSGSLGNLCSNRCTYSTVSAMLIGENAKERSKEYKDSPDLAIKANRWVQFQMMMTLKNAHVIDAVYFADMMYKDVGTEEKNFRWFSKLSMEKQIVSMTKFSLVWISGRILGCLHFRWMLHVIGGISLMIWPWQLMGWIVRTQCRVRSAALFIDVAAGVCWKSRENEYFVKEKWG